jgi:periplasmic copper chaperone A
LPFRLYALVFRALLQVAHERLTFTRGAASARIRSTLALEIAMFHSLRIGVIVVALTTPASAHVTLETAEAKVGAPYKAVLRVPHGCEDSATIALRVRIPDGVIAVKPMPKPGWTLTTTTGKYEKTYTFFHNAKLSEGVTEITWSGGKLPDAWYDEFVFQGFLAGDLEAGKTLYFPVVQECEKGVHRWIEIPAAGKSSGDYPEPAPALKLLPKM